eukprot:scaffold212936_cov33-Tisochrysis_lutea.AAC.5
MSSDEHSTAGTKIRNNTFIPKREASVRESNHGVERWKQNRQGGVQAKRPASRRARAAHLLSVSFKHSPLGSSSRGT